MVLCYEHDQIEYQPGYIETVIFGEGRRGHHDLAVETPAFKTRCAPGCFRLDMFKPPKTSG